jgi:hypothetical protein
MVTGKHKPQRAVLALEFTFLELQNKGDKLLIHNTFVFIENLEFKEQPK